MKIQLTVFSIILLSFSFHAKAQNFLVDNEIELGVRVGTNVHNNYFTYNYSASARKHFDFGHVEVLLTPYYTPMLTALYTIHGNDLIKDNFEGDVSGFTYFFGFGGHGGAYYNNLVVGVDGIAGIEYKIPNLPLKASVDYKPTFDFISSNELGNLNLFTVGSTVRYVF